MARKTLALVKGGSSLIERTPGAEAIDWSHCPEVCRNDERFVALALELKQTEAQKGSVEYARRLKRLMSERWNALTGVASA